MWLINTKTLQLEEFVDPFAVQYAILSHTWSDEEVSFNDMRYLKRAKTKKGFEKIAKTCRLAIDRDLEYAWVDTCCIDKTSSAELSEAINAMFSWYQNSTVCFAFLEDLKPFQEKHHTPLALLAPSYPAAQPFDKGSLLRDLRTPDDFQGLELCKWFTRGWTLQELIAPNTVEFYDSSWQFRFTKESQAGLLSKITRIDIGILTMKKSFTDTLVAVKMSWAAYRQTKRSEDIAYCLLGIFDINMPMLYGEGQKAFQRLQEEIIRQIHDPSILAWLAADGDQTYRGVLVRSPLEFAYCSEGLSLSKMSASPNIALSNKGVKVEGAQKHLKRFEFMGLQLGLIHDCPKCRVVHEVFLCLLPTEGGLVRASPEACCRDISADTGWKDAEAYRQVSQERSDYLKNQDTRPILFLHCLPEHLRTNMVWFPRPNSAWSTFYTGFVGETMSKSDVVVVEMELECPDMLTLIIMCFSTKDEDLDVELHFSQTRSSWDWVGGNDKDLETFQGNMNDTILDLLLEEYRQKKQSGQYQPQTTVSLRRRQPGKEPLAVTFGVKIEERNITFFQESSRELEEMDEETAEEDDKIDGVSAESVYSASWKTVADDENSNLGSSRITGISSLPRSNSTSGHGPLLIRPATTDPEHASENGQTSSTAKRSRSASV